MKGGLLRRNPAVAWREEARGRRTALEGTAGGEIPCLTLVHLGTMYQINFVGAEIWKLCDGTRDEEGIVGELLGSLEVTRDELAADVSAFVGEMLDKGWLVRA